MNHLLVVGEDGLCGALGVKLVKECMSGWQVRHPAIDCKGVTNLVNSLARYCEQAARVQPIVCVADSDGKCPIELIDTWLPKRKPKRLILRLAVTEAESWLLADHEGFSAAFEVTASALPRHPDEVGDPKATLLKVARRSRIRGVREEVVSQFDHNRRGTGYNQHLRAFVEKRWSARRAAERSPSLARAIRRLGSWSSSLAA